MKTELVCLILLCCGAWGSLPDGGGRCGGGGGGSRSVIDKCRVVTQVEGFDFCCFCWCEARLLPYWLVPPFCVWGVHAYVWSGRWRGRGCIHFLFCVLRVGVQWWGAVKGYIGLWQWLVVAHLHLVVIRGRLGAVCRRGGRG